MKRDLIGWGIFLVVVAVVPWTFVGSDRYLMFLANVMLMFMVMALSWDVVARTGQLSLAHGAFFGLGAYSVAIAFKLWALPPLAGLVVAAIVGGVIALVLGLVTLRLRGIYFAIATLAFAEVWRTVALQVPDLSGGTVGIAMPPLFGGDRIASYYVIGGIFLISLGLSLAVRWFDIGRSVSSLVFPIFGGLYTSAGPVIGTLVMRSLEEYLRVTPPWKDGYQVIYGLVIVVAVLFLPRGVLGLAQRYAGRLPWRFSR